MLSNVLHPILSTTCIQKTEFPLHEERCPILTHKGAKGHHCQQALQEDAERVHEVPAGAAPGIRISGWGVGGCRRQLTPRKHTDPNTRHCATLTGSRVFKRATKSQSRVVEVVDRTMTQLSHIMKALLWASSHGYWSADVSCFILDLDASPSSCELPNICQQVVMYKHLLQHGANMLHTQMCNIDAQCYNTHVVMETFIG